MSKRFIPKSPHNDWEGLAAAQDKDIDLSDIPEVTEEQMACAKLRVGGEPVPHGQVRVALLLDAKSWPILERKRAKKTVNH